MESITTIFHGLAAWLLLPISGSLVHDISPQVSWHARFMVIAWSVLIPLGIVIARFFKVTAKQNFPVVKDNPFWWHAHRLFQYSGMLLMLIGFWQVASFKPFNWHKGFGYSVIGFGLLQVMSAYLRGSKGGPTDIQMQGDHFDMTKRRLIFEKYHKSFGYGVLVLVVLATVTGLFATDAPRWMWLIIGLWWLFLILTFAGLQKQARHVDTYTAIWGYPFHK